MKIRIFLAFYLCAVCSTCALAEESRLEQRLTELEGRVRYLERQITGHPLPPASPTKVQPDFSGRFIELNSSVRRSIDFKAGGKFFLKTQGAQFTGTWEKSGSMVSIRVPDGFTEQFRLSGDALVDARGVTWVKATGQ
ncbi:MAG: hypothetical protein H6974_14725 [Gammaproteobacteria bacterium]|nr:hypothetical protein [Gammaproteobacteria bacterium]MCP5198015.1 hypothetical protein [Gammaproteobacteria bacterium]